MKTLFAIWLVVMFCMFLFISYCLCGIAWDLRGFALDLRTMQIQTVALTNEGTRR